MKKVRLSDLAVTKLVCILYRTVAAATWRFWRKVEMFSLELAYSLLVPIKRRAFLWIESSVSRVVWLARIQDSDAYSITLGRRLLCYRCQFSLQISSEHLATILLLKKCYLSTSTCCQLWLLGSPAPNFQRVWYFQTEDPAWLAFSSWIWSCMALHFDGSKCHIPVICPILHPTQVPAEASSFGHRVIRSLNLAG